LVEVVLRSFAAVRQNLGFRLQFIIKIIVDRIFNLKNEKRSWTPPNGTDNSDGGAGITCRFSASDRMGRVVV
jgi:hypothetical protein